MTTELPTWTEEQLHYDVQRAIASFRQKRLGEPLTIWKQVYFKQRRSVRAVLRELRFRRPERIHSRNITAIYAKQMGDVLRYLCAPPISQDDLKTLTSSTLSVKALRKSPYQARAVLRVLLTSLDPTRFPWVKVGRQPSPSEWRVAIAATSALMANQAVATFRRTTGKNEQEQAIKDYLKDVHGLFEDVPRKIVTPSDAPAAGSFCGESEVRGEKADIVVALFDGRLLLIECKVSNSAINSVKRVVHEAAGKAAEWTKQLGAGYVVPAAALTGVFKARNLTQAQGKGLRLIWAHRLGDLGAFIESTKR